MMMPVLPLFQYLLVRLKGRCGFAYATLFGISIPLGTIKRILPVMMMPVLPLFQYLLVRLKDHQTMPYYP